MADRIRASLIVLNYNGAGVITACIESLLAGMAPEDELIVVDNASTDGSAALVPTHNPQVRLVQRTVNNYIFGLNDGVQVARGDFVAFLNNDIVAERGFVEVCLAGFDRDHVFAVCPRILDKHGAEQGSLTTGRWHRGLIFYDPQPHDDRATQTFFAVGGQSFFRKAALDVLGSIDELFWPMYHEDIELSYRAWKAGKVVRFAPQAVVHHVGGHSTKRVFTPTDLRSFVRQNEYLTVWKNVTSRRLLAEHVLLIPIRLLAALAHRDWGTLRGFGHAVSRLPALRRARKGAKAHHVLTDEQVLELVASTGVR